tara:strand:- start:430 stop:561 length:132 start_codon:yes stop_codon:yes gene_type:complete
MTFQNFVQRAAETLNKVDDGDAENDKELVDPISNLNPLSLFCN